MAYDKAETWRWWQARRLTYNLWLAGAGWAAFFATLAVIYAFKGMIWRDWPTTLMLTWRCGVAYLVVMAAANAGFLLGPLSETVIQPADPALYRTITWRIGLWGSVAFPFVFPLLTLCFLSLPSVFNGGVD